MAVPSLPKVGIPPAQPSLRKIALEEHLGHPSLFMRDSKGRYFEVVQSRLPEFDGTRLEAMYEAGVETVRLSLTTFGIQAITDGAEAQNALRTVNDCLHRYGADRGERPPRDRIQQRQGALQAVELADEHWRIR